MDIATVSEHLGHSSVATTADIYSHAIRGKDRAAAETWDGVMQRARAENPLQPPVQAHLAREKSPLGIVVARGRSAGRRRRGDLESPERDNRRSARE